MNRPPTPDRPSAGQITLRYWAAARAATGVAEEIVDVEGPVTLADLLTGAIGRHGGPEGRAAAVLSTCSVLLGDRPVRSQDPVAVVVDPGQVVELLPPFAGG